MQIFGYNFRYRVCVRVCVQVRSDAEHNVPVNKAYINNTPTYGSRR